MPKFYPNNENRDVKSGAKAQFLYVMSGSLVKFFYFQATTPKVKTTLPIIYGNQLCEDDSFHTVAKGIIQNNDKSPCLILSNKEKKAIQGHIIWHWE